LGQEHKMIWLIVLLAQWQFGQNKIQYRQYDWHIMETKHFDIYYYKGGEKLARFAAYVLEGAQNRIAEALAHKLSRKVPVILYTSYIDFEGTNVIPYLIEESVGGFTEMFKNRIVVPFNGSYEDFRHVLVHELVHAFQYDILYGRGLSALIPKTTIYNIPLWYIEGMAEYFSLGWDVETQMIIGDALFNDKLVSIQDMDLIEGTYLMYKEGQSIIHFIAQTYGEKKIGEIFYSMNLRQGLKGGIEKVLHVSLDELNLMWRDFLRRKYWSLWAQKRRVPEAAIMVTKHTDYVFNIAPAISPDGKELVYISDRDGYDAIYLASTFTGKIRKKLITGGQSETFESLHLAWGGIDWHPQRREVVFVAKKGKEDVLYIYDVEHGKIRHTIKPHLDAVYKPKYSPDGKYIVFRGTKDGQADLYIVDIATNEIRKLTDDIYDDKDPWWMDSSTIVFVSDRQNRKDTVWYYGVYGLYMLNLCDGHIYSIMPYRATYMRYPMVVGDKIMFVADWEGSYDLYVWDIGKEKLYHKLEIMGGIYSPTVTPDGKYLAMSVYNNGGWDIFIVKEPLNQLGSQYTPPEVEHVHAVPMKFVPFKTRAMGFELAPDWVFGKVEYSSYGGIYTRLSLAFSDILGNHRFYVDLDNPSDLTNSNILFIYWYLPKRWDWLFYFSKVGGYYYNYRYGCWAYLRMLEISNAFSYPIDRFHRVDLWLGFVDVKEEMYLANTYTQYYDLLDIRTSYVIDNALWRSTGPAIGTRASLSLEHVIPIQPRVVSATYYELDYRHYTRLTARYTWANRFIFAGLLSRQLYHYTPLWVGGPDDLRGYDYGEFSGYHIGIWNTELRYPFIDNLKIAFPLPLYLRNIRGGIFVDMGFATNNLRELRLYEAGRLKDLKLGFGTGVRMNLGYFVLQVTCAWHTDLASYSAPYWYVSFNPEF